MTAVILVHVYQQQLNEFEKTSLQQLVKVTAGKYPIRIISPTGLETEAVNFLTGTDYAIEYFEEKYFKGLKGYNRLMTHPGFYERFKQWDYLLIHHLDSYMFKDELEAWCSKGYANIGAPLYEYDGTATPLKYIGIGNGGFCLRHIPSCIKVLYSNKVVYGFDDILKDLLLYNWKGRIARSIYYLDMFTTLGSRSHYLFNRMKSNEDVFWGILVPAKFEWFKVPLRNEAAKFSMEYNCEQLFEENNNELPFGCHGWYKPLFKGFWKPLVKNEFTKDIL